MSQRDVRGVLEEILDSLVKLDLLVYFHRNPDAADTAEGLAVWVGSDPEKVQQAAEDLVKVGILEKKGDIYHYTRDPQIVGAVERFVNERYMVREERMRLIAEILQKEGASGG
ncbi:MAG TPA: hypothetical protein EYP65_08635 [Armatimonadetes bacterium]|nr:hypothetical protein [Armatimonadota bacterium]